MIHLKPFSNLAGIDLNGCDLSKSNLRGTNLNGANLSNVNLNGANLQDASLRGANLTKASLCGVNLADTNLDGANLTHADLRGSDLRRANLNNTNLTNTDLSGVDVRDTKFNNCIGLNSSNIEILSDKNINCQNTSSLNPQKIENKKKWWFKFIIVPVIIALIGNGGIVSIIKVLQNQHHLPLPTSGKTSEDTVDKSNLKRFNRNVKRDN